MSDDDLIITMQDIRACGFCGSGARRWFAEQGLDFHAFMKNGMTATAMLATGDALGEMVVVHARERANG